jgi:hypothetical protein
MADLFDSAVLLAPPGWAGRAGDGVRRWAERLAARLPVFVVQPDGRGGARRFEPSSVQGVTFLRVNGRFDFRQFRALSRGLGEKGCRRPLLLISDARFVEFAAACYAPLKVWHAGQSSLPGSSASASELAALRAVLEHVDVVAARTPQAAQLCRDPAGWQGPVLTDEQPSLETLEQFAAAAAAPAAGPSRPPVKVLILYDPYSTHVSTVAEHLESFRAFSRHQVCYLPATQDRRCPLDLLAYDAVVLHYSVRLMTRSHLSASFAERLAEYRGLKVLFAQDEYENTEAIRQWIARLGIQGLFTCVPGPWVRKVYPPERCGWVEFVPTLTGFVPRTLEGPQQWKPLAGRRWLIGYRGRQLGYWFGKLGQEKIEIGRRMREICQARGLPVNIEWTEDKRIYGAAWYGFLSDCRATLGSESGANIFDWDGSLKARVEAELRRSPGAAFDEIFEKHLKEREGEVRMNQISPKAFEAIALGTALVLFEGEYSGVLEAQRHFIPLRKDFGNADEVLKKLADDECLSALTRRAYEEVLLPGKYSYGTFIRGFDAFLDQRVRRPNLWAPVPTVAGWRRRAPAPGAASPAEFGGGPEKLLAAQTCGQIIYPRYSPTPPQLTLLGRPVPQGLNRRLIWVWEHLPGAVRRVARPVLLRLLGW